MAKPGFPLVLTAPIVVWATVWATAANAEKRSAAPPMKSTPAKAGAAQAADAKSADSPRGTKEEDGLADDDSRKAKSGDRDKKDRVNKKGTRKGSKDAKPSGKRPPGRSREADASGPQILVGADLNLEPET